MADEQAPSDAGQHGTGSKKEQSQATDKLMEELDSLIKESDQIKPPPGTPTGGDALQEARSVVSDILGTDAFVGEESLCPLCGSVTNVYASQCEQCGALFDEDVCRCANCEAEVPKEAIFCPSCNNPLTESDALCPVCAATVPGNATSCPSCGALLAEGEMRCASCGNLLEANSVACTSCGTMLMEGAVPRAEAGAGYGGPGGGGGGGGHGGGGTMKATIEGGGELSEVSVENKIENRTTVEAILKPAEEEGKKNKGGNLLQRAKDRQKSSLFPFTAVIGQEKMKLALILNVVDPLVGGVLITGQKGTGKSVTVRGLSEVTPDIRVIDGCRFSCDPDRRGDWCWECMDKYGDLPMEQVPVKNRPLKVVDLPLNATEDRVVGTLDVSKVLTEGIFSFESGVLAEANRGVLYVDEINLLDDYVVDVLLDAAAMGVVTVEREGVSVRYPARFVMVGSMNPEEGGLRPQLLDRIALQVQITGIEALDARMEVVQRRMDFEKDPLLFRAKFDHTQQTMRDNIRRARENLPNVKIPPKMFAAIPKVTTAFGVDGHRADIMIERGASALAAMEGKTQVDPDDIFKIAEMVLPHRMRRKPFEQAEFSSDRLKRMIADSI